MKYYLIALFAALSFIYCEETNPSGPGTNPDPNGTDTSKTTHRNPANSPFIGTWVFFLDTAKDNGTQWSDSVRKEDCRCNIIIDNQAGTEYHWECPKPDTLIFSRDSFGDRKYFYTADSVYYVYDGICIAVNCDSIKDTIVSAYALHEDTLWAYGYYPGFYNPFYKKVTVTP
jgi:hypothetical protein